jgi:hypothetical protein
MALTGLCGTTGSVAIPSPFFRGGGDWTQGPGARRRLPLHDTAGGEEVLGGVGCRPGFGEFGRRGFVGRSRGFSVNGEPWGYNKETGKFEPRPDEE